MTRRESPVSYKLDNGKFTPEYISWIAMKQRCLNPRAEKYPTYGGRGITVCRAWMYFPNFLGDMGARPEGYTLDRKNGDGNYEPGNCRWATAKEQAENRKEFINASALKTHCPAGHPYSGNNLRITKEGNRKCRQCDSERARRIRKEEESNRVLKGNFKAKKTHCINGHQFCEENTRYREGHRVCKVCQRDVAARQREKRKESK